MKSKIYSSEYMKSSSKGQRWIPAFANDRISPCISGSGTYFDGKME